MSYSFTVTAATKAEAKAKIAAEFDAVIASQPVHSADRAQAQAAAEAFVDVLVDPSESEQIRVSVNGSVGWRGENEFVGANLSISASTSHKV